MKQIVLIIILVLLQSIAQFMYGNQRGYLVGYNEASQTYSASIKQQQVEITNKTEQLNKALENSAQDVQKEVKKLLKDTQEIKAQVRTSGTPVVIVKDAECVISSEMLDARQKMIERANQ